MYMYAHPHSYAPGASFADLNPQTAGAYHSSEIPFFLLTLDAYNRIRPTRAWSETDHSLASTMSDVLVAFASSGVPETPSLRVPRFDSRREQLIEFGDSDQGDLVQQGAHGFFHDRQRTGSRRPGSGAESAARLRSEFHEAIRNGDGVGGDALATSGAAGAPPLDVPVDSRPVLEDRFPPASVGFARDVEALPDLVYSVPPGFRPLRLDLYRPGTRTAWRAACHWWCTYTAAAGRPVTRVTQGRLPIGRRRWPCWPQGATSLRPVEYRLSGEAQVSGGHPGRENLDSLVALQGDPVRDRSEPCRHLGRFGRRATGCARRDLVQGGGARAGTRNRHWQHSRTACRDSWPGTVCLISSTHRCQTRSSSRRIPP